MDDTPLLKRLQNLDWLVGLGLALAAFGLYLSTLAPTVLEADAGEFQFVPWLPGIAHPTGYPLYVLLSWLWTHAFLFGEVAWRMNLLSALFAAATVGLTYGLARQLLDITLPNTPLPGRVIAAVLAAGTFAVTPTFWSQAIVAEVYSFHAMFVAAILWLTLKFRQAAGQPQAWSGKLLALTFGLSLTHHRTTVLLLPAILLFLLWPHKNNDHRLAEGGHRLGMRRWIPHALLPLAPLLLYLYLPLVAPTTPYAILSLSDSQTLTLYDNSLPGFWEHVMGAVFSGELRPTAAGPDRLLLTWQLLRQQVGWVGLVLALAGLVTLWQRRRFDLLALTGVGFLAFVTFNLFYFIGDVFVLFIPAWLLVALWLGLGALGLAHWLADRFVQWKTTFIEPPALEQISTRLSQNIYRLVVFMLVGGFLLLVVVFVTTRKDEISQKNNRAAAERWSEILAEPIPPSAILLSNDRNEIMPMWYYQYVEGYRPDLLGLFPLIVTEPAYANVGRLLDQALASGRPVYLIKPMAGLSLKADLVPEGILFRASPIEPAPTYPQNLILPEIVLQPTPGQSVTETIKLRGYDLIPAQVTPGDQVTINLYWQAVQELSIDYTSYVHLVDEAGQGISQSDHQPGGDFYPSHYWQTGEILRDQHRLTLPPDTPPGVYQLRVGLYYQPEPGLIVGMGDGQEIGRLNVAAAAPAH